MSAEKEENDDLFVSEIKSMCRTFKRNSRKNLFVARYYNLVSGRQSDSRNSGAHGSKPVCDGTCIDSRVCSRAWIWVCSRQFTNSSEILRYRYRRDNEKTGIIQKKIWYLR